MSAFRVVIPARYASTRLPGKPLLMIAGKPMIQHVYERAKASDAIEVLIATDDERIARIAEDFAAPVVMTHSHHVSGTDRLQEVAATKQWDANDIVVNVQGDEPLIPPEVINQVARNLALRPMAGVATLAEPITAVEQFLNPNVVKVVRDRDGYAHYFSRAPIPWPRDAFAIDKTVLPDGEYLRHLGLYAYRVGFLNDYVGMEPSPLEKLESLEQLRALWSGVRIHVDLSRCLLPPGVDTFDDLERVRALVESPH